MEAEVTRVLRMGSSHDTLSEGFGLSLTGKDLQTLNNLNWLNDEVSTHYPQGASVCNSAGIYFTLSLTCIKYQKYMIMIILCL